MSFIDTLNGWMAMDGDTVYRTRNGGISWTPYLIGVPLGPYQIQFVDSLSGWLGGSSGTTPLLHTSDGGISWNAQSYIKDTVSAVLDLDFIDRSTGQLFVAIGGIYRLYSTRDGGNTWSLIFQEVGEKIVTSLEILDTSNVWLAGTEYSGGFVSLIRNSTDGGQSFADTLVQEGSGLQKIKMFNEDLGWAVDAMGGVLRYAPVMLGDLNWDGELSAADVVLEINRVFVEESFPAPDQMGDVNCDARFTGADIVWLVYRVFMQTPFPCDL